MNMFVKSRHRLGFYCPGAGSGGPWRYVHSILQAIDPDEFEVVLLCDLAGEYGPRPWIEVVRLSPTGNVAATASDETRRGSGLPKRKLLSRFAPNSARIWAGFAKQTRRLAAVIRPCGLDLFHTQNTGCEESPVAGWLAGVPNVVGTFHVDSTYDLHHERSGPAHRLLEAVSNRCLDVGIAVSRAAGQNWIRRTRLSPARVATIYNGIDPEKFRRRRSRQSARAQLGLPVDERLVIGGVGRLDEAKGFTYLIEAAAQLQEQFPKLMVVIAGEGPMRKHLERQTANLGLSETVRFLGFQTDVQPVLDALDVFVLPSLCETLGYAFLEAMASELPTVGTTVGGIPEVIVAGETGFLVPPRNPGALAKAMRPLLQSAEMRQRMGAAGRERVIENFREEDMVRKTVQVYRGLLGSRNTQVKRALVK